MSTEQQEFAVVLNQLLSPPVTTSESETQFIFRNPNLSLNVVRGFAEPPSINALSGESVVDSEPK